MMPKANLLEYPVASKRLSVPREPTSLTHTRTDAHRKATALKRPADSEAPSGFHHTLSLPRFPQLESPEPPRGLV